MNAQLENKYFEYLAKLILETFLPDEYHDLECSDSPDLRMSKQIGIEVTRSMIGDEGQASGVFNHIKNTDIDSVDSRYLTTLNKIDYQLVFKDNIIVGYGPKEAVFIDDTPLKKALSKKLKKIHNYDVDSIDLFIFSPGDDWFEEDTVHDFMNWALNNEGTQFKKIIVYEYSYLYVFETSNSRFSNINIDKEKCLQCRYSAKAFIDSIN